ncbi:hypothetical protein, partial [Streptococcus parasanguinis]|uniref:hypothetical protein n=1 Tax=Streptococcus parasanguinis TaxID=1318 RepID=UPI00210E185F
KSPSSACCACVFTSALLKNYFQRIVQLFNERYSKSISFLICSSLNTLSFMPIFFSSGKLWLADEQEGV